MSFINLDGVKTSQNGVVKAFRGTIQFEKKIENLLNKTKHSYPPLTRHCKGTERISS